MRSADIDKTAKAEKRQISEPDVFVNIQSDLRKIVEALNDIKKGYIRTHRYYKYVSGTLGDVTVGAGGASAIKFPDAGQSIGVRNFIRSGEVIMVRVHNTGGTNPAYVAFNHNATTDEPLMVPAGAIHEFELKQFDFVSICSTDDTDYTTVRVSFWGE